MAIIRRSYRAEQRNQRANARATMPDQQMRPKSRYPVDRYLGESSKRIEMVNIIDDDLWKSDPALRPEDEIILRKLQEMLQSTAEDLKVLSQEMSRFNEPRVQVKSLPTPLDEEFNEKVHIEELVDAKFHGYKVFEPSSVQTKEKDLKSHTIKDVIKTAAVKLIKNTKNNIKTQTNHIPVTTKQPIAKRLGVTKTRTISIIDESKQKAPKISNTVKQKVAEFSYSHIEPEKKEIPLKVLQIQHMPGINIRSELKEQKVLHLDIFPEKIENVEPTNIRKNISVVTACHEVIPSKSDPIKPNQTNMQHKSVDISKTSIRKISKMSPYESSSSNNSVSPNIDKRTQLFIQTKPMHKIVLGRRKLSPNNKKTQKSSFKDLELWKKKLNVVYAPSHSDKSKNVEHLTKNKQSTNTSQNNVVTSALSKHLKQPLNNAQYIPYSFLTVGGARASDLEKEIDDVSDKGEVPLSPIIDKILSSRENSYSDNTKHNQSSKILTTSDENLLQEVIDIERKVRNTIKKNILKNQKPTHTDHEKYCKGDQPTAENNDSYDDDFEDEKSENNEAISDEQNSVGSVTRNQTIDYEADSDKSKNQSPPNPSGIQDTTYVKTLNLSLKGSVDVFEFLHTVDTQESSTQSHTLQKISLKETQTSPINERSILQPIHNDLWSAMDPEGKVEKLFQSEKEFIKKLILEEYGDLVEKTIAKPSTSNDYTETNLAERNVTATQKLTQTSPPRVQCSMTSPKKTKTRTTSPLELALKVHKQTSPLDIHTDEQAINIEIENLSEDLGISINLSSPRFSLRFPQNSRELLSNLEVCDKKMGRKVIEADNSRNILKSSLTSSSSSSSAGAASTSELSSLGEVYKPKRKSSKSKVASISSSDCSQYHDSSDMPSIEIVHLKSDGELSSQLNRNLPSKSDGEIDFRLKHRRKYN